MSDFGCEKLFFRAVRFLQELSSTIEQYPNLVLTDQSWCSYEEDGTDYVEVYFGCKPKGKKGAFLYVTLYFTEDGPAKGLPLWIFVHKDETLWNVIKVAYQVQNEAVVDEDWWGVGFSWPFSEDTSFDLISSAAKTMGEAIARAFEEAFPSA